MTTAYYYTPSGRNIDAGGSLDLTDLAPPKNSASDSASADYRTLNGRPLQGGGGIIPDVEVNPTPADIASGRDVVFEKGLEVLREKIKGED